VIENTLSIAAFVPGIAREYSTINQKLFIDILLPFKILKIAHHLSSTRTLLFCHSSNFSFITLFT